MASGTRFQCKRTQRSLSPARKAKVSPILIPTSSLSDTGVPATEPEDIQLSAEEEQAISSEGESCTGAWTTTTITEPTITQSLRVVLAKLGNERRPQVTRKK